MRFLPLLLLAACASSPPTTATPAATEPASEAGAVRATPTARAPAPRYAGQRIQLPRDHGLQAVAPDGLVTLETTTFASGMTLLKARAGDDLVVLLADETGLITDDRTMAGLAGHLFIPECTEEFFLGIAAEKACDGVRETKAVVALAIDGASLRDRQDLVCSCDFVF